jgi:hypothetical protein
LLFAERGTARCTPVQVRINATPVHDSWHEPKHEPNAQPDKRTTAACSACVDHVCLRTCARGSTLRTGEHCWAPPTHARTNKRALACTSTTTACQRAGMSVRACVTWAGWVLTAVRGRYSMQGRDSVRRQVTGPERTSGGTSDASSAFGASTCASHRMRQRIPAQCARGGPATPADGYYSVLFGNYTGTLRNS